MMLLKTVVFCKIIAQKPKWRLAITTLCVWHGQSGTFIGISIKCFNSEVGILQVRGGSYMSSFDTLLITSPN